MVFSSATIEKREQKRLFLLKFKAMHDVNRMTWDDCAVVYEKETGKPVSADVLRLKVRRAERDVKFVRVSEFPEKVVVSLYELSFFGCVWCALRKFWSKMREKFGFMPENGRKCSNLANF